MPSETSPGPCRRYPLDGSLADDLALELADAAEEGEQEPPLRGRGVEPGLLQGLDLRICLVNLADDAEQVPDGAAEPREFSDDNDVARAQSVEQVPELRPVAPRAAHLLLVNPFTPILPQLIALPVQVLVLGRDPCISDSHVFLSFKGFLWDVDKNTGCGTLIIFRTGVFTWSSRSSHIRWLLGRC